MPWGPALLVLLLAPAMLTLFGETTWRLPRFLDRSLPHLDLERHERQVAAAAAEPPKETELTSA